MTNTTTINPKTKKLVTWLLIGAAISVSAVACGMHSRHPSDKMVRRMALAHVEDLMDDIHADDAQRAQFDALAEGIVNDALAMKKAHKADEKTLLASLQSGTIDREALHTQLENHLDKAEDFLSRSLDKVLDAYESLRPDQKKIILDKLAEHMENN